MPFAQARDFGEKVGMLDVIETSAKENVNIDQTFLRLAKVQSPRPFNVIF